MSERDYYRIKEIREFCLEISETILRFGNDFDTFFGDKDYYKSLATSIFQIGELSIGITDDFKGENNTIPWHEIRAMRNVFAHNYGSIIKDDVWSTVTVDIPILLKFCDDVLSLYEDDIGDKIHND